MAAVISKACLVFFMIVSNKIVDWRALKTILALVKFRVIEISYRMKLTTSEGIDAIILRVVHCPRSMAAW
ncbi:MAG: hypothetical protein WBF03_19900 [Xanthobacteraceae bacterium]